MNKQFHLTKEGLEELKSELSELSTRRGEIAEKLQIARDYGDLSENAEYHSARDEQSALEVRAKEIERILLNAEIISTNKSDKVKLGTTVVLKNDKEEVTYTLVGSVEANPLEGKISNESPIGKALLGKAVGDEVEIQLPASSAVYKVKSIS